MNTKTRARTSGVMGFCETAAMVEAGQIQSTTTPEGWHALCHFTSVEANARVTVCTCSCHEGKVRCTDCGLVATTEDEVVGADSRCVDRETCGSRLKARLDTNAARIGYKARQAKAGGKGASPARKKTGRCEHCGQATSGGRFAMGHDAKLKYGLQGKLKSNLHGTYVADDVGELVADTAELIARNWMPPELAERLVWMDDAKKLAAEEGFLGRRVAARVSVFPITVGSE